MANTNYNSGSKSNGNGIGGSGHAPPAGRQDMPIARSPSGPKPGDTHGIFNRALSDSQLGNPQMGNPNNAGYRAASKNAQAIGGNERTVVDNVFRGLGLGKIQRSALIGRGDVETGGFDPHVFDGTRLGDNGTAHGLAQWHQDRWGPVKEFIGGIGGNSKNAADQAAGVVHEMQFKEKPAYTALREARNIPQAMDAVNAYERPAGYSAGGDPNDVSGYGRAMKEAAKHRTDMPIANARMAYIHPAGYGTDASSPIPTPIASSKLYHDRIMPEGYKEHKTEQVMNDMRHKNSSLRETNIPNQVMPDSGNRSVADGGSWTDKIKQYGRSAVENFTKANQAIKAVGGPANAVALMKLRNAFMSPMSPAHAAQQQRIAEEGGSGGVTGVKSMMGQPVNAQLGTITKDSLLAELALPSTTPQRYQEVIALLNQKYDPSVVRYGVQLVSSQRVA